MFIGYAAALPHETPASLLEQERTLRAYECTEIYTESIGEDRYPRPQLEAALQAMRTLDTLVITDVNRLGAAPTEFRAALGHIEARGAEAYILNVQLSTQTPGGRLLVPIIASIDDEELPLLQARVHHAAAQEERRGAHKNYRLPSLTPAQKLVVLAALDRGVRVSQISRAFTVSSSVVSRLRDDSVLALGS